MAYGYTCDVSSSASVMSMAAAVREEVGPVSILVNNAEVVSEGRLSELSDEAILRSFNINVLAHFRVCNRFCLAVCLLLELLPIVKFERNVMVSLLTTIVC